MPQGAFGGDPAPGQPQLVRNDETRYNVLSMRPEVDELVAAYQHAERRLRETLLGDAMYSSGAVRGEERRQAVGSQLRQLRTAFDALVRLTTEQGDALDEALRAHARRVSRRAKRPS